MRHYPIKALWQSIVSVFVIVLIILVSSSSSVNGISAVDDTEQISHSIIQETTQQIEIKECTCYIEVFAGRLIFKCDYETEFPRIKDDYYRLENN